MLVGFAQSATRSLARSPPLRDNNSNSNERRPSCAPHWRCSFEFVCMARARARGLGRRTGRRKQKQQQKQQIVTQR